MSFLVRLDEIIIPAYMRIPVWHKTRAAKKYIMNGSIWPLQVQQHDNGYLLRDGYARYLANKELQREMVEVEWVDLEAVYLEALKFKERAAAYHGAELTEEDKQDIRKMFYE